MIRSLWKKLFGKRQHHAPRPAHIAKKFAIELGNGETHSFRGAQKKKKVNRFPWLILLFGAAASAAAAPSYEQGLQQDVRLSSAIAPVPVTQSGVWSISAAPAAGSVTVTPGTGTWATSGANAGSFTVTPGTGVFQTSIINSVTVTPGSGTFTVGSHAVTNAGVFAVQSAQAGSYVVTPGTGVYQISSIGALQTTSSGTAIVNSVTVTPGTGTWNSAIIGSVVVTPGTGTFQVSGAFNAGAYTVTPGTGTFPVSGANAGSFTVTPGTGTFPATIINSVTVTPGSGTFATSGANAGAFTVTPGTGVWSISFSSGSASTPLYIVANGALFVKSTDTAINWSGGAGIFTSTNVILGAGTASIGDVFNTPRVSSVAIYAVPGSTMTVAVSSNNLTALAGQSLPLASDGLYSVPMQSVPIMRFQEEEILLLREISMRLLWLLDGAGKGYGRAEQTDGKEIR